MDYFHTHNGRLHAEGVDLAAAAAVHGTPCYVYSRAALEAAFHAFDAALAAHRHGHLVCYAVKANPNLAVLNCLARLGAGFDVVSGGELARVLAAGGDAGKVVFSGVGKRADEMRQALTAGIRCFNIESVPELERLNEVAGALGKRAPIALRVNPDVDAHTHPYIATGLADSKFGIPIAQATAVYARAAALPHIEVIGVDCHIGSQLTDTAPFVAAAERVLALVDTLAQQGIILREVDLGGGLGIPYQDETPPAPQAYVAALLGVVGERACELLIEPGRAIIGNAGVLLTRVEYLKLNEMKNFAVVDAAMNDLMRPALYDAWHAIEPVQPRTTPAQVYDVVGPVCESGDFLGTARSLALEPGDLLAIRSAGAYGMSMSSNYNTRPRAAELMVDGTQTYVVRSRETVAGLFATEHLLP